MFGFSKSSKDIQEKSIFFHEDHSNKEVNEALVGRKGKSLFELRDMDIPVPTFFVISPKVFKKLLLSAFDHKLANLMEKVNSPDIIELEKLILNADFDKEFIDELSEAYTRLSGFSDSWVGVRSSVVFPQREDVSFSGIFKTELNVKGVDHIAEAIKHVYISVFKNRVLVYGKENSIDVSEVQMAIVIQKMIQPEVSGIAYTLDPVTQDNKKMSIEAVFGLGDVISEGSITPDQYILNKRDLEVVEKHISPQEWMKIRKPGKSNPGGVEELQKIQISKTWSHQQKIEDENTKAVAKVALIAEESAKRPQALEWVWESGNVWVLQSKAILSEKDLKKQVQKSLKSTPEKDSSITEETVFDVAIDIVKDEKLKDNKVNTTSLARQSTDKEETVISKEDKEEIKTLDKLSKKMHKIAKKEDKSNAKQRDQLEKQQLQKLNDLGLVNENKNSKLEFLLTGIGSSHGEIAGEVKVIDSTIPDNLTVTKETILLLKNFTQEMEAFVLQSAGVLMDEGGLTSDIAILCRENGIPAVVGTGLASALLKDGDIVKIDGNVGSVYKVTEDDKSQHSSSSLVSDAITQSEEDSSSVKLAAERARAIAAVKESEAKTTSTYAEVPSKIITATKVMLFPEEGTTVERYQNFINLVDGVCYIDLDELMLADKRHPLAYVESKTFREYSKNIEKILDNYTDAVGGSEVIVTIGSATVDRFRSLVKGSSMEDKGLSGSLYGAQHYLSNPELFKRALSIVKKVRNVYKSRNLSLAIHSPMNGDIMKSVKKEISASGLKRTGTFNIYAVIDNPAEVILADDILDAGIDGLILNTPRLARLMQGLPLYGDNVKYDIGVSSVMKILESALSNTRGTKHRVIIVTEENEILMKRCIEWGVYGIAVRGENFNNSKRFVADEEAKMIMGIGVVSN